MFFKCNVTLNTSPSSNVEFFVSCSCSDNVLSFICLFYRFDSFSITKIHYLDIPPGSKIYEYSPNWYEILYN